jgi:hypothetical protein
MLRQLDEEYAVRVAISRRLRTSVAIAPDH